MPSKSPFCFVFRLLNETAPRQAEDGKLGWAVPISLRWGVPTAVGERKWGIVFRFSIPPFFPKELSR